MEIDVQADSKLKLAIAIFWKVLESVLILGLHSQITSIATSRIDFLAELGGSCL